MKPVFLTTLFIFTLMHVFAQKNEKDRIKDPLQVRCYYLFSKSHEVNDKKVSREDTMVLDIGSSVSRFYDPARLGRDSVIASYFSNQVEIKSMHIYKDSDAIDLSEMKGTTTSQINNGESYQIIKDKSGAVKVIDYVNMMVEKFEYEDNIGPLPWKVLSDTATILGYQCQKASVHFRGRDYLAWFTTEIPISDGPWKFSGLPGLILKVEDSQQLYSFSLIGLEQPDLPVIIHIDGTQHIKCTRAEFEKMLNRRLGGAQANLTDGNLILSYLPAAIKEMSMELE